MTAAEPACIHCGHRESDQIIIHDDEQGDVEYCQPCGAGGAMMTMGPKGPVFSAGAAGRRTPPAAARGRGLEGRGPGAGVGWAGAYSPPAPVPRSPLPEPSRPVSRASD